MADAGIAGPPNADATASGPDTPGPQGPPGGPPGAPPGGGPVLAALANRRQGPQVTAPGPGDMANSMNMLTNAIAMIQQALPGLPAGGPIHKDVVRAISSLSRHLPQGAPTVGVQQTQLQDLLRNLMKNALLSRIMQQQKGGPGGEGAPEGGPGGPPPMPSTPLPGA